MFERPALDTTERVFRKVWEMACYAGFLTGREAARLMRAHGRGTILFTGATASLRGGNASGGDPAALPPDSLTNPESVAEAYWMLHQRPRDGWTFELDLRPYGESW
jgi:NAD(P)-dependent dehydrogenase (short-subunit alcohol dehydrogenase family)